MHQAIAIPRGMGLCGFVHVQGVLPGSYPGFKKLSTCDSKQLGKLEAEIPGS